MKKLKFFYLFAHESSEIVGNAWTFIAATLLVLVWLISGPFFHYSDTWQLSINTFTTIITFLMVFLIQNTQNRSAKDIHIKLDELILVHKKARNSIINLDKLNDEQLKKLEQKYKELSDI